MHSATQDSGRESTWFSSILEKGVIALQLGLLLVIVYHFDIESESFLHLGILTWFGFLIHSFLPQRFRLSFFALLSMAGIVLVLGVPSGLWLLALGLVLIGACHLPFSMRIRVAVVVGLGVLVAALQILKVELPWSRAIWPVLASMFMFRTIVYLYDQSHGKAPKSLSWSLSYFFLLPNVCFPLFPVVDYQKFHRHYYNEKSGPIYQRGIRWMFRGLVHLIAYRVVYYYLTIGPADVATTQDLLRYMVTSFLLYLRVSGQFHLIIGMLLLFGFNLPETNNKYLFAAGFTDFWRRINIYWKDFMMKIFFYPAFFRMKRMGGTKPLVLATAFVFLITWILHAYQWFWLTGSLLFEWHDILFWSALGLLVVIGALRETKKGRKRALGVPRWTVPGAIARGMRMVATFATICVLWSMWTAQALSQWLSLWDVNPYLWVVFAVGIPLLALGANYVEKLPGQAREVRSWALRPDFWPQAAWSLALILTFLLIGSRPVYQRLGPTLAKVIPSLQKQRLNDVDRSQMERGYYEQIIGVNPQNASLWELYSRKPPSWKRIQETEIYGETGDVRMGQLRPNMSIEFKTKTLTTNSFGMRDKEYSEHRPEGVYRMALMGTSHVMGSGVEDDETMENLVEERLNRENSGAVYDEFEILNLAMAARSVIQTVFLVETRALAFEPDVLLVIGHHHDATILSRFVTRLIHSDIEIPYPEVAEIFQRAEIDATTPDFLVERRLKPYLDEILDWAFARIVADCREQDVKPLWALLPLVAERLTAEEVEDRYRRMEEIGFTVLDLRTIYDAHEGPELVLADWDDHPNALAHRLAAEGLYQALIAEPELPYGAAIGGAGGGGR